MSRLNGLGLSLGDTDSGPHNAITDVSGVSVGHADLRTVDLCTGVTAVVPYPKEIAERKLFIGSFAVDGGQEMSGLQVAEDFGTFSSPIVFAPAPAVGQIYEGMIRNGLERDPGLTTVAGWPPVVVGIDDTDWNDAALVHSTMAQTHVAEALANARGGMVSTGNAGIGGGLQAFGFKGGIGTASRRAEAYTLGVLAAVNGGQAGELRLSGYPLPRGSLSNGPQSFAVVVATNAPLIPLQLERLAGRAALGLARTGLWSPRTRAGLVIAFSTTGIVQDEPQGPVVDLHLVGEESLYALFVSAAFAAEEAVFDALLQAEAIEGLDVLPQTGWPEAVRRFWREG